MALHRLLLLGAGKIGGAIAKLLASSGDYEVVVGDTDEAALKRIAHAAKVQTSLVDATRESALRKLMRGRTAVVSATSFNVNPTIARAAAAAGASYFDLTEDVETTKVIRSISRGAREGQIFMPQCGLAPGFVSIAANHLAQKFDKLDEVRMRVGALPQFPTNEMKYNLTWSTDGLINEYGNACEAIYQGRFIQTLPLEGLEHFSLDGVDYEAFNTSGGVGTLCETLRGKVRTLDYKTIRYRGHRELISFLMNELRLNDRRALLKDILENAVPMTPQDVVLIFCSVSGWKEGRLTQLTDARKIYHGECLGERWGAIQITTAAGLCAVLDLHLSRQMRRNGFVKQEEIGLEEFLANRFGKYYACMPQEHGAKTPPWVRA
jgi:saccharopine dehydrogenase-like NADP-dependent oxidoreductase